MELRKKFFCHLTTITPGRAPPADVRQWRKACIQYTSLTPAHQDVRHQRTSAGGVRLV